MSCSMFHDRICLTLFVSDFILILHRLPDVPGNGFRVGGAVGGHLLFRRVTAVADRVHVLKVQKYFEYIVTIPIN